MKLNLKLGIFIIIFLAFFSSFVLFIYLVNNTSLFTKLTPQQIAENNNNPENSTNIDYTTLNESTLEIAEQFKTGVFKTPRILNLPKGFEIILWSNNIPKARALDFTAENNIVVTAMDSGEIYLIKNNFDSKYGEKIVIDDGLQNPHGIDYFDGDLYVGEQNQVVVYRNLTEEGKFDSKDVIVSNLPSGGHSTRTVLVGPNNKLYVSIGSSCNLCEENDSRRAAIMEYDLDGTNERIFASGLRNSVDFVPRENGNSFQFWGVENGRDGIGDDIPPEEVNIIQDGKNYGWPYCYGNQIANPEYTDKDSYCKNETESPMYNLQAHSAPLGLTFVPEESTSHKLNFPISLKDDLFVTFHGSWNRTIPTGYKVVRINSQSTQSEPVNFITGWVDSNGEVWGRPVGIRFDANGSMFIADDKANALYRVRYSGN